MSQLTSHVLDGSLGRPASGVAVRLLDESGAVLAEGVTDADGRVGSLGPAELAPGTYHLTFETGPYFEALGVATFYPSVTVTISIAASTGPEPPHYHVPLLLSPFAYSTYRGS